MEKGYHALDIDFEIPEILEQDIADFLRNLNEEGRNLADCHEEEIRNVLNECSEFELLTDSQISLLREYYCRSGIYRAGAGRCGGYSIREPKAKKNTGAEPRYMKT